MMTGPRLDCAPAELMAPGDVSFASDPQHGILNDVNLTVTMPLAMCTKFSSFRTKPALNVKRLSSWWAFLGGFRRRRRGQHSHSRALQIIEQHFRFSHPRAFLD